MNQGILHSVYILCKPLMPFTFLLNEDFEEKTNKNNKNMNKMMVFLS